MFIVVIIPIATPINIQTDLDRMRFTVQVIKYKCILPTLQETKVYTKRSLYKTKVLRVTNL